MFVKSVGKKIISIMLLGSIVVTISACSLVNGIDITNNSKQLSVQEIARLVVNAINDEKNVSDSYSSIPEDQRTGVSYSYFSEFTEIMRHMSKKNQYISSFRVLGEEEEREYLNEIFENSGCSYSDMASYGSVDIVEVNFNDNEIGNFRFFISTDDSGKAYLSSEYVSDFIGAYNYIEHYFTMLREKNIDAIIALLKPKLTNEVYINSVLEAKAKALSDYYQLKVKSLDKDYIFNVVTPFYMEVSILETVDEDGYSIIPHKVSVTKAKTGIYYINDIIPFDSSVETMDIYNKYFKLYNMEDVLTSQELTELIGNPYSVTKETLTEYNDDGYEKLIKVFYMNMIITVYGNDYEDGSWSGRIVSVSLFKSDYSINNEIYVGMNISELLLIYPMLDEYNYVYTFTSNKVKYGIEFKYDENYNVSQMLIKKVI